MPIVSSNCSVPAQYSKPRQTVCKTDFTNKSKKVPVCTIVCPEQRFPNILKLLLVLLTICQDQHVNIFKIILKIHFNIDSGTSEEQVSKQSVLFLLLFLVQYIGWIRNFPSADYLEIDAYASVLPPTNLPCVMQKATQDCLLSFLMLLKCRQQFHFFFTPSSNRLALHNFIHLKSTGYITASQTI